MQRRNLAPFRRNVEESGMSDEVLDGLFTAASPAASHSQEGEVGVEGGGRTGGASGLAPTPDFHSRTLHTSKFTISRGGTTELSRTVNWRVAPRNPVLRDGELHVWLSMAGWESQGRSLLDVLSTDEVERARRFNFSRDRERFIRTRGVLRTLLGR